MRRQRPAVAGLVSAVAAALCLAWQAPSAAAYEIDMLTHQPLVVNPGALDQVRPQAAPPPRATVAYTGSEAPGTIVVSTAERRLYFVLPNHQALKYGIGVGRPGFTWGGTQHVAMKREWPDWTPPLEMIRRRPDLPHHMAGGLDNPLGARAMYLGRSLYRIHGSNEPETIGQAVSSGCIRMTNDDVIDLYGRVRVGARVVVMR